MTGKGHSLLKRQVRHQPAELVRVILIVPANRVRPTDNGEVHGGVSRREYGCGTEKLFLALPPLQPPDERHECGVYRNPVLRA